MRPWILLGVFVCVSSGSSQAYTPMPIPDMNYTDLHRAAEHCDLEKEQAALAALTAENRKTEINRLDRDGYTPLAYAAQNGCMEIVQLLVENGAAVDRAEELLSGWPSPQHKGEEHFGGWTPLLHAAEERRAAIVQYLLMHGAEVNIKAGLGQTPLMEAIDGALFQHGSEGDRNETLRVLLKHGADINLQGERGWTPLMRAVFQGDASLVQWLIEKGADRSIADHDGKTALNYAEERGENGIIQLLT